jgi:hypothetical protein
MVYDGCLPYVHHDMKEGEGPVLRDPCAGAGASVPVSVRPQWPFPPSPATAADAQAGLRSASIFQSDSWALTFRVPTGAGR